MPSMVTRKCKYCHDLFPARVADVKRGWAKFCSKSCKAKEQERRTGQYSILMNRRSYEDSDDVVGYEYDSEKGWLG